MSKPDYRFRPKKAAERVMLVKALQRIQIFSKIQDYKYIGFGALYYVDFKLFHKELGIRSMLSIEKDNSNVLRYEFNKPFDFVNFKQGESHNVLPRIDLSCKSIVWLDYTDQLCENHLHDISTVFDNLPEYSVVFITLNHHCPENKSEEDLFRILESKIGADRVGDESIDNMCTNKLPYVYRSVISKEISNVINSRNRINSKKIDFFNLCSIKYKDSAHMMTCGFVLTPHRQKLKVKNAFKGITYLLKKKFYEIDFPMMTLKEQLMFTSERGEMEKKDLFLGSELSLFDKHQAFIPFYTETVL